MDTNKEESKESYDIRSYEEGDEEYILPLFNSVFSQNRSIEHWRWRFKNNPFGKHKIKLCWKGKELIAQYAGYPVAMEWEGERIHTIHLGDIMTHPDYRSRVMGRRGMLANTANEYFDEFGGEGDGKAILLYGTVTGRHLKLGKLLLKYTPLGVATQLGKEISNRHSIISSFSGKLLYIIQSTSTVPQDVNSLWRKCRKGRGLETVRDYEYLKWRYEDCPDTDYTFWSLRSRFTNNIQCLIVTRIHDGTGCLVDFLCVPKRSGMFSILDQIEQSFLEIGIKKIKLWMPEYHPFSVFFQRHGYGLETEPNNLSITGRSFSPSQDVCVLEKIFFYNMGD